ncbi:MAG: tetratricopeptide repeat protein, partial [Verrucomicrobiae bacterium]|nr:tetratricopeptide repeat protein [Verrucomicrobiae bacterium]
ANPDAFNPDFAMSLNNLAILLSDLGRRSEALGPAQEAVELYRALARANPDAFNPDLAMSLGMMGQVQEANGNLDAALACFREGIEVLTPAFGQLPEAFAPLVRALALHYLRTLKALSREPDYGGAEAFLVPAIETFLRVPNAGPFPAPPTTPGPSP